MGIWKDKEVALIKQKCVFIVGDAIKIRFWEEVSCDRIPLSEVFPRLYYIVGLKEAKIVDLWVVQDD